MGELYRAAQLIANLNGSKKQLAKSICSVHGIFLDIKHANSEV